jgi:RNA polymerase sigma factor (sigma-70 family)
VKAATLFSNHTHLADLASKDWWLPGTDQDDVRQEALIALWEAARTYNGHGTFPPYARMVIRHRLADRLRHHTRYRHMILTHSTRPDEHGTVTHLTPERHLLAKEHLTSLITTIREMTPIEQRAIRQATQGHGCTEKTLSNALCRARRKLKAAA